MHVQDSRWSSAVASGATMSAASGGRPDGTRTTPLRVDAQRNLEHVLRAAREVFGELGYGAPVEAWLTKIRPTGVLVTPIVVPK